MLKLKETIDLTKDIKIANNIEIKDNKLTAKVDNNIITLEDGKWFINDVYQGDGAIYVLEVNEEDIIEKDYFEEIL